MDSAGSSNDVTRVLSALEEAARLLRAGETPTNNTRTGGTYNLSARVPEGRRSPPSGGSRLISLPR